MRSCHKALRKIIHNGVIFIHIEGVDRKYSADIVQLWNSNFDIQYHVTEKMILQKIFNDRDVFEEGSFLLTDGLKLAGLIAAKLNKSRLPGYEDCAWISTLVVDGKYRNMGYGSTIYCKAEEKLREKGIKKIILGGELDNFFSGIPQPTEQSMEFFRKKGYVLNPDEHYDLIRDVSEIDFDQLNVPLNNDEAYSTREMASGDKEKLGAFFDQSFPGRWKHEVMGYVENGGDLRNVLILWHNEEVVGFCKIHISESSSDLDEVYGSRWGSLGPIGLRQDARGKGLGSRILRDALKFLQCRGGKNVKIDWTILKDFYGQFGFKPLRTYRGAYKLL